MDTGVASSDASQQSGELRRSDGHATVVDAEVRPSTAPPTSASSRAGGSGRCMSLRLSKGAGERSFGMSLVTDRLVMNAEFAIVSYIFPNSPASRAGIREGWVVVQIDGCCVRGKSVREVAQMFRDLPQVVVTVQVRDGKVRAINATASSSSNLIQPVQPPAAVSHASLAEEGFEIVGVLPAPPKGSIMPPSKVQHPQQAPAMTVESPVASRPSASMTASPKQIAPPGTSLVPKMAAKSMGLPVTLKVVAPDSESSVNEVTANSNVVPAAAIVQVGESTCADEPMDPSPKGTTATRQSPREELPTDTTIAAKVSVSGLGVVPVAPVASGGKDQTKATPNNASQVTPNGQESNAISESKSTVTPSAAPATSSASSKPQSTPTTTNVKEVRAIGVSPSTATSASAASSKPQSTPTTANVKEVRANGAPSSTASAVAPNHEVVAAPASTPAPEVIATTADSSVPAAHTNGSVAEAIRPSDVQDGKASGSLHSANECQPPPALQVDKASQPTINGSRPTPTSASSTNEPPKTSQNGAPPSGPTTNGSSDAATSSAASRSDTVSVMDSQTAKATNVPRAVDPPALKPNQAAAKSTVSSSSVASSSVQTSAITATAATSSKAPARPAQVKTPVSIPSRSPPKPAPTAVAPATPSRASRPSVTSTEATPATTPEQARSRGRKRRRSKKDNRTSTNGATPSPRARPSTPSLSQTSPCPSGLEEFVVSDGSIRFESEVQGAYNFSSEDEGDTPTTRRRRRARQARVRPRHSLTVERLIAMGFQKNDAEESVKHCGDNPDKCMVWIVSHFEEQQYYADMNQASIESEKTKHNEEKEQKKQESESLRAAKAFTSLFENSYILSADSSAARFKDMLGSAIGDVQADCYLRVILTKLLKLESQAIRWYKQAAKAYMLQLAERLEAALGSHSVVSCCSQVAAGDATSTHCAFIKLLYDEERALTHMLFSMPVIHGGVPLAFLQADEEMHYDLEDDGFEVLEQPPPED